MVGLLKGGTKSLFGSLLGGLYLGAVIFDGEITYGGDGTIQVGANSRTCKVKVDSATEAMRAAEGFADTDRAIFILAASLAGEVRVGQKIRVEEGDYAGKTFGVRSVDRPPGGSYFLCRGASHG